MQLTFLVNLMDFSDAELVRLKNLAQITAKKSLTFQLRLEEFIEDRHRKYFIVYRSLKASGIMPTLKIVFAKIHEKLTLGKESLWKR